jgi:hypothetical protein
VDLVALNLPSKLAAVVARHKCLEKGLSSRQIGPHLRHSHTGVLPLESVAQKDGASSCAQFLYQRRQSRFLQLVEQRGR